LAIETRFGLRFENLQGESLKALPEWESAWIILTGCTQSLAFYRLELAGLNLPLQWQPEKRVLMALWQRQGPGLYPLRLWFQSDLCFETELAVWPEGWGQRGLFALLEELSYLLPHEWGKALGLGQGRLMGQSALTAHSRGWRQEFARLQECLGGHQGQIGLLSALTAWEPNQALGLPAECLTVPAYQARKPLFRTAWHPGQMVRDQRPRWQYNTPENRFVKNLVGRVELRLNALLGLLEGQDFELERAQLHAWSKQLHTLTGQCRGWDEIHALASTSPPVLGLLARPSSRPFWSLWQNLNSDFVFVSAGGPRRRSPESLPWLYQTWSLLHLILALLQTAQKQGWKADFQQTLFPWQASEWVRVLPRGKMVLCLQKPEAGIALQVWVERQFGPTGPIHSISYAQRPDLVVHIVRPNGPDRLWLWDAKYRLGDQLKRPEKVDLDRMHAYRDALRLASGDTVVDMACILYPGPSQVYAPGLMALQASPLASQQLQTDLRQQISQLLAGLMS